MNEGWRSFSRREGDNTILNDLSELDEDHVDHVVNADETALVTWVCVTCARTVRLYSTGVFHRELSVPYHSECPIPLSTY